MGKNNKNKLFLSLFLVLAIITAGGYAGYITFFTGQGGTKVEATVTDKYSQVEFYSAEDAEKEGSSTFMQTYLKFTYELDGRKYNGASSYYQGEKGDVMKITIDPRKPESILNAKTGKISPVILLILVAGSAVISFVLSRILGSTSGKKA